jgi:hypothetical protein
MVRRCGERLGFAFAGSPAAAGYADTEVSERVVHFLYVSEHPHGRMVLGRGHGGPCSAWRDPVLDTSTG